MSNRLKGILAAIAAVIILIVIFVTPAKTVIVRVGGNIISPVCSFFSGIGNSVSDHFSYMGKSKTVYETNKALEKENAVLKNKLKAATGLESENKRLKALLDLKNDYADIPSVGAEIVARESGNWFTVFTINKGEKDGVKKNQPVLCDGGLVGHTTDVGSNWAKVVTLIDTSHSASAMAERSGDYVQIDGEITLMGGGLCKMTNVSDDADVIVGDVLVTSGIGGVYPKGIVIGTVSEFKKDEEGTGSFAVVKPAVDFKRLNELLVLKTESETK